MKKIGILYICTGPYVVFWDDFYKTIEDKFLLDYEKHYFVFTDNVDKILPRNDRIHINFLAAQPWPLITLLRFHTFLSIRDELEDMDYLMFSNANIVCDEFVSAEEFLPREEKNEELSFTTHPGYENTRLMDAPYDRNSSCLAYVPYNCGQRYVIGAMYAGNRQAFLEMSELLRDRINEDLKKGIIARWHDESHVNRYIIGKNVRILSPSYCYPWGMEVSYPKKMSAVSKQDKFDVISFKGLNYERKKINLKKMVTKIVKREMIGFIVDSVKNKKVHPL